MKIGNFPSYSDKKFVEKIPMNTYQRVSKLSADLNLANRRNNKKEIELNHLSVSINIIRWSELVKRRNYKKEIELNHFIFES